MRVWFGSMNGPTRLLWLYAVALGAATGLSPAGELSGPSDLASRVACAPVLALWVMRDAQRGASDFATIMARSSFFSGQ